LAQTKKCQSFPQLQNQTANKESYKGTTNDPKHSSKNSNTCLADVENLLLAFHTLEPQHHKIDKNGNDYERIAGTDTSTSISNVEIVYGGNADR
jgi:hypothetical protein